MRVVVGGIVAGLLGIVSVVQGYHLKVGVAEACSGGTLQAVERCLMLSSATDTLGTGLMFLGFVLMAFGVATVLWGVRRR